MVELVQVSHTIDEGDREMIKLCWQYMDGAPLQKNELTSAGGKPMEQIIRVNFVK